MIFAGSTRALSFKRQIAKIAAGLARQAGAEVTRRELSSLDIPPCNADQDALGTPPDAIRLQEIMSDPPARMICPPEYNGSYTALRHNTLDRGGLLIGTAHVESVVRQVLWAAGRGFLSASAAN
jgi:NAD(P)H-dependent FMN reductase